MFVEFKKVGYQRQYLFIYLCRHIRSCQYISFECICRMQMLEKNSDLYVYL